MLDNADVFALADEHSYAAFVGVLSSIYLKAHASAPYRSKPYRAVIVVSPSMCKPYRGQPESSLARLLAINARMQTPAGGIDLTTHVSRETMFHETAGGGLKHTVSHCWPIKGAGSGEYITQNPPPKILDRGLNKVRYFELNLSARKIDYGTPIGQVFSALERSKCHVCYQGGTAWLSVGMDIPTIIVHPFEPTGHFHYKAKLFGQDTNINILSGDKIIQVRRHPAEIHTTIEKLLDVLSDYIQP